MHTEYKYNVNIHVTQLKGQYCIINNNIELSPQNGLHSYMISYQIHV